MRNMWSDHLWLPMIGSAFVAVIGAALVLLAWAGGQSLETISFLLKVMVGAVFVFHLGVFLCVIERGGLCSK